MKSKALIWIITAAVLVVLIAVLVVLSGREKIVLRSPMLTQDPSVITYIEGLVEVDRNGSGTWETAAIGQRLREGDRIRCGSDGLADIRIYSDGLIRMTGGSEMLLSELTIKRQTIDIDAGTIFAKFHLLFDKQELRFRTPDAVAAVRGTELVFEITDGRTLIHALSGITEVLNPADPDQRVLLTDLKTTTISGSSPPTDPTDIFPGDAAKYRSTINDIHSSQVLLITQDIKFEPDSANILEESLPQLDDVARLLRLRRVDVLIAGHTAEIGNTAAQVRLSEERAAAIQTELVNRGINARRLTTIGYGSSRPIGDNATAEGRALNRRVEFTVVE